MIIVDSHHHLWDPRELDVPPAPPEAAILNRAYMPDELQQEFAKGGVDYGVLVQGYPQTLEANKWFFRQANSSDSIAGVVAWVNLENPDSAAAMVDELVKEPKFVGVRHITEGEPDLNWMVRNTVLESLGELARRDIPYDMNAKPQHLKNVLKVIEKVPHLRMVIDHIAKPNIARGDSPHWAEDLAEVAQYPQAYCKLSGMITEADWTKWRPTDLAPYVHHVIDVFGWNRVMFGSDWPVCLLAGSYQQVWDALSETLGEISDEQKRKVFGANARQFYKLKIGGLP